MHAFSSWVFCRIILFIYICIMPAAYGIMQGSKPFKGFEKEVMQYPSYMMLAMMVILELLQIFWTYYIAESFISFQVTNKIRHSYDWYIFNNYILKIIASSTLIKRTNSLVHKLWTPSLSFLNLFWCFSYAFVPGLNHCFYCG